MTSRDPERYHHGDLRAALLSAAEAELEAKGVEGFSLRAVAKRAGVSHAAPAHHFGDVAGLLTALAARGYTRFLAMQRARQAVAPDEPRAQLVESGMGYVDFALAYPALFALMFGSRWPEGTDPALKTSSEAAFRHLAENAAAVTGGDPDADPATKRYMVAVWALVHGLAHLLIAGKPGSIADQSAAEREATIRRIIADGVTAPL